MEQENQSFDEPTQLSTNYIEVLNENEKIINIEED